MVDDWASKLQVLTESLAEMIVIVGEMGGLFPAPEFVSVGKNRSYRHAENVRTPTLAAYLKAVKLCSTLRAALILVGFGHVHEAYALCRISDELTEDILFFMKPLGAEGSPSELQQRILREFYQEELADPEDALSTQDRYRAPRYKIRAAIHGPLFDLADPSMAAAVSRSTAQTFSGFVHGAYVHIIDMYGGDPGRYHTTGFHGTPRMDEALRMVPQFVLRASMAIEAFSLLIDDERSLKRLRALYHALAAQFLEGDQS